MPDVFREVNAQIRTATLLLVELGLVADQNFPNCSGNQRAGAVTVESELSNSKLHGLRYPELYSVVAKYRHFNMLFRDGGILQFHYEFSRRAVSSHRLAFLPSPELEAMQLDPELYLDDAQEIFADILEPHTVAVPIRFDHDSRAAAGRSHPMSHMTLGMFTNCRIPATAALYPLQFVDFVLRSFYNSWHREFSSELPTNNLHFPPCATAEEYEVIHLGIPGTSAPPG